MSSIERMKEEGRKKKGKGEGKEKEGRKGKRRGEGRKERQDSEEFGVGCGLRF